MQHKLNEADREIQTITGVLSQTSDDDPKMRQLLTCLANSHDKRFELRYEPDDIHKVIEYTSKVLTLTPDDDPGLPDLFNKLGEAYSERFQRLGSKEDMEKAIEYQSLALKLIPDGHPDLPRRLTNLAVSYRFRFKHLGELGDIENAIKCDTQAVELTPQDDQSFPEWLKKLGTSHSCRFERLGELNDIEKAIEYQSRALALTPDDHPDLSTRVAILAVSHKYRFGRLGDLSDLEQAIEYGSRALALTPDDHPRLSIHLANLAVYHKDWFGRLGELSDLEQAIEYESRALALTPDDHPDSSSRLSNLAVAHIYQFQRLGELRNLEQAIEYESRALTLTPDDHPHLSTRLANLAVSHKDRFGCLGGLGDLEQAIEYETRALALTPDDHPDSSIRLVNLAVSYKNRFRLLGELRDLEQAIEYESRALAAIDSDHPNLSLWNFNHALSYIQYYVHSNDATHLQVSLSCCRIASMSLAGAPRDRFKIARNWATLASNHDALRPTEAYQATVDLLPQFIWLGATLDQRYEDLKTVQTLAADAALAAILSSNYSLALEWLEHARCIVWNQNLMLRSPLDQLRSSHPSLATRLQKVADKLHAASCDSRESRAPSSSTTHEQVAQEHRRLAKEYNILLSEARALPGFEDFLQPLKIHRLVNAARSKPIVVINCHEDQCDALVILPQQTVVNHIPLPNFNGRKAQSACSELRMSVDDTRQRERGTERRPLVNAGEDPGFERVLASLWYDVVKPILDFFGYTKNIPLGNLPHITWCPTGAMTFLPLHAAGDYDQPRSRVFNYVISSYTPTLTALLESTPCSLSRGNRVLAIGQAATPGHTRLPGTTLELVHVRGCTEGKAAYTQLLDEAATTTTVLNEMEQHDWVHLACHAHQNVGNATASGFFLHDGVLDLASINRRSFKGKGLAYLSACQTATGDEALPEEAVHLASGMLMAGYTSVIATMWSVHDEDAPGVASAVYSQLMMDGKLGNGEAGRALNYAVAELRESIGEKQFGRWVPFIHIGS